MVLPLDQAEELFSTDAGPQADRFLALLATLLGRMNASDVGMVVVATIRTDRYEAMQGHPALDGVGSVLFDALGPMPPTQFATVVTGPAKRTGGGGQQLSIAPDLVDQLVADAAEGADTLPLLALTLSRLYDDYGSTGELTLAQYSAIGGMGQVVQTAIDEVLASDPTERTHQLALLRTAFIPWLATVYAKNDQPMRRVARYADLPTASRHLIDALVAKRLLVKDTRDGHVVVEVALESLLRQWDALASWLREERKNLINADDLERNAAAWAAHDRDPTWLVTGTRLEDAETLLSTPQFVARLATVRDYVSACRATEDARSVAAEQHRMAELRHVQERQRAAETRAREAIAQRLNSEAVAILAGRINGGDVRAFQELLAARRWSHTRRGRTTERRRHARDDSEDHRHRRTGHCGGISSSWSRTRQREL